LGVGLRAENLADKRYREHGSGLDEPGRNFIVSLDYRF
jgi:outer membrane receptor protein involved in Fe transport